MSNIVTWLREEAEDCRHMEGMVLYRARLVEAADRIEKLENGLVEAMGWNCRIDEIPTESIQKLEQLIVQDKEK